MREDFLFEYRAKKFLRLNEMVRLVLGFWP